MLIYIIHCNGSKEGQGFHLFQQGSDDIIIKRALCQDHPLFKELFSYYNKPTHHYILPAPFQDLPLFE